jgi:hypothetical protein
MNLKERIALMTELGKYLKSDDAKLQAVKEKASIKNAWFTPDFIDLALQNVYNGFLEEDKLFSWVEKYHLDDNIDPKRVGIVMAGNIPLVGFHDFLCVFISGHFQNIKLSEKDDVLLPHILEKLAAWNVMTRNVIEVNELLKDCEAYIATGSNNSSRYFNYYFGKYPSVIRKNKTSAAVLKGDENIGELDFLADDVHTFFGMGCRNVTSVAVPPDYDFLPMLDAFKKYDHFAVHSKYKNNYDYHLALLIMNNTKYMATDSSILVENENPFSPVSQLHYTYYNDYKTTLESVKNNADIQCVIAKDGISFGEAQQPGLMNYADGKDVMQFLLTL